MNNPILGEKKNLIGCITSRAFPFGEDEITAVRRGTTSFVRCHTEVAVASSKEARQTVTSMYFGQYAI